MNLPQGKGAPKMGRMAITVFASSLLRHWVGFVTGSVVALVLLLVDWAFPRFEIPSMAYLVVILIGFVVASYFTWKEEYQKGKEKPPELVLSSDTIQLLKGLLKDKDGVIEKLQRQIAELQAKQAARSIGNQERATIREWLWARGKGLDINIYYLTHVPDGENYARQFSEIFEAAEWKVKTFDHLTGPDGEGIVISGSRDKQFGQNGAQIIKTALGEAGIDSKIDDDLLGTNVLSFVVGRKPDSG